MGGPRLLAATRGSHEASPPARRANRERKARKKFELLREFSLADFVSVSNAACGVCSIFFCLNFLEHAKYEPYLVGAFFLLPLALIFDILDGFVARWRKSQSPYGADLDSLADVISFSVAPAVLGFTLGLRGIYDSVILSFFVCCGVARLARYNVTAESMTNAAGKVTHYEGFPVPFSLLIVLLLAYAYHEGLVFDQMWGGAFKIRGRGTFHPFSLIYGAFGCAHTSSRLRVPKP